MWKWEWICWFVKLISPNPAKRARRFRRLVERLSLEAGRDETWWSIYREFPKQAVSSTLPLARTSSSENDDRIAIIVQGPVVEVDDFTLETLKLYRKTMRQSQLILSTWDDISAGTRDQIAALGVTIVTSEKPEHAGPHNLNLQIVTTQRGLLEAKKLGCRYAMKTRVDTRIHLHDADRFCLDMLEKFPLSGDSEQKERLLVSDFATLLYVPYHPADLWMFGCTDDLLTYWSRDLCGPEMTRQFCSDFDEMLSQSIPEVVLCRSFLQRTRTQLGDDIEHWWEILSSRFIVIDRDMIDLFWPKYNYNRRLETEMNNGNLSFFKFAQWMQLYSHPSTPSYTIEQLGQQRVGDKLEPHQD